jgi:hypothetical protein
MPPWNGSNGRLCPPAESPRQSGRKAKDASEMLFGRGIGRVTARTAGATVLTAAVLFCALATADSAYAASLKQDVNSPVPQSATFINPAAPQPIVPPAAAPAARAAGKAKTPAPSPQVTPADTAAVVNKMLAPRQSDPNVPLPQENLAEAPVENAPLTGPRVYGRDESGNGVMGAILGLRIPIPADRSASAASSTSSTKTSP